MVGSARKPVTTTATTANCSTGDSRLKSRGPATASTAPWMAVTLRRTNRLAPQATTKWTRMPRTANTNVFPLARKTPQVTDASR